MNIPTNFYVTLLSNNSLMIYEDNVLSAFTNLVNLPTITSKEDWEVGVTELYLNDGSTELPTILFIYSDIIKPRCIGNKNIRCIRVLPYKGQSICYDFHNVEYYPLEISIINDISILIANSDGTQYNFQSSTTPNFITLHFRKHIKTL